MTHVAAAPFTLLSAFLANATEGLEPLQVTFTGSVAGTNTTGLYYMWDFNNDAVFELQGPSLGTVTNSFPAGIYSVSLTVTNSAGETAASTRNNYIRAAPAVAYVSPSGSQVFPYTNWTTAATNIQAAVDAGADGTVIWVTNGLYTKTQQVAITESPDALKKRPHPSYSM